MPGAASKLRSLPWGVRLGLSGLVLTMLGGLAASTAYVYQHHERRDTMPGLSMDDLRGAYHGVYTPSPLERALTRGHPPELAERERELLLNWLLGRARADGSRPGNPRLAEEYDAVELGDDAPLEVLARACVSCHQRRAPTPAAPFLEHWADVRAVVYGKDIPPTPTNLVVVSTHAHALSLGVMGVTVVALALGTRWHQGMVGMLSALLGGGLAVDLGCWWAARFWEGAVLGIVAGGSAFMGAAGLLLCLTLADLWLPRGRSG